MRRVLIVASACLLLGACGGDGSPQGANPSSSPAKTATARVLDNSYEPAEITLAVNGTVTWTYEGPLGLHTVTETNELFDSHPDCPAKPGSCMNAKGQTFSYTFAEAGRFSYSCKVHGELMSGTVVVR